MQVMNLCLDDNRWRDFLDLTTKEGRLKWVQVSWAFTAMTSK
jgi:major membrane immunogen (membrane-anchored lipoprotein)